MNEPGRTDYRLSLLAGSLTLPFDSFKMEDVGAWRFPEREENLCKRRVTGRGGIGVRDSRALAPKLSHGQHRSAGGFSIYREIIA